MLFRKNDPTLRPADDSFRRLTGMEYAFSGLNVFVCAWAITPPNAPANPELFIGIVLATIWLTYTRLYASDPKMLTASCFYMNLFVLIPISILLSYLKWWIMLMCAAELIFLAIHCNSDIQRFCRFIHIYFIDVLSSHPGITIRSKK